jgi:hypothetical protein
MNPKITPEIQSALDQHPVGPIRLQGEAGSSPVYLVRLDDILNLHELVKDRIQEKLAEADDDLKDGRVLDWDPDAIKRRGRERLGQNGDA